MRSRPPPADFTAVNSVELDGLRVVTTFIVLRYQLPNVVQGAAIGRRIGDVISHRFFGEHPLSDAVISNASVSLTWGGVMLAADASFLIIGLIRFPKAADRAYEQRCRLNEPARLLEPAGTKPTCGVALVAAAAPFPRMASYRIGHPETITR